MQRDGVLKDIDIAFYTAGGVLFGVKDYVPSLMGYVEKYGAALKFNHNLGGHRRPGEEGLVLPRPPPRAKAGRSRPSST